MSGLAVTGMGVVAPPGMGREAFAGALAATVGAASAPRSGAPTESPHVLQDFDIRALLGRKGTSDLDRATGIALVACAEALADSGLDVSGEASRRVGMSLGTTSGSLRSMSEYTRETLVSERPYLVRPGQFPNTVMNCATGQAAIRHGLRGINSTLAAGQIAFFGVLRQTLRAFALGYLDAALAGAVEEFTAQRAWVTHHARADGWGAPPGEGAVVLVVERPDAARAAGRHVDATVDAVATGFCPGGERRGDVAAALAACARRALAGAGAGEVATVAWSAPVETASPRIGEQAAETAVAGDPARLDVADITGECGAAASALQLAAILTRHRDDPARDGQASLLLGWTADGAVAAAVVRGYARQEAR